MKSKADLVLFDADGTERRIPNTIRWDRVPVVTSAILVLIGFIGIGISIGRGTVDQAKVDHPAAPSGTQATWSFVTSEGSVATSENQIDAMKEQWRVEEAQRTHEIQQQLDAMERRRRRPILSPPADAPPSRIKVGPYSYVIKWTTAKALLEESALASTDIEGRVIWLTPERGESLRDDVVHELLHCAKDLGTGGSRFRGVWSSQEENDVEGYSAGFLSIIQDNPELMRWIAKRASD